MARHATTMLFLAFSSLSARAEQNEMGKNPLRKVITLLQNMAQKVEAEGERERKLYEEFSCYCKTGAAQLSESINGNDAKIPAVQSDIEASEAEVVRLKGDLKKHQADRVAANQAADEAKALREKEHAAFVKESTEYQGYVDALARAIPAIENGMAGTGLLQTGAAAALRQAVANDEKLFDEDRGTVLAFLEGTAGYVPKSGEIVGILKQMEEDYKKDLAQVQAAEAEAVGLFEKLIAAKAKEVRTLGDAIEKKTARVGELAVEIVKMKQEMTEAEAQMVQDKEMLANLGKNCETKQKEMGERVKTRAEELAAIHDTIKILNDDDALELFKKTLPSPGSFMQLGAGVEAARTTALAAVQALLPLAKDHPEVRFLELKLKSRKVDFSKVLKMIDDMVALLKQEQVDDDSKKEYCGQQLDAVEDKIKELERGVSDLEVSIEERTDRIATLTDEIAATRAGIAELDKLVLEETEQRKAENKEFTELMSSNTAAKELLEFAKNRLQKFYNPSLYKAPPKPEGDEEAAPSFLQQEPAGLDAAPETPTGEYKKKSEESAGVLSMIDLLVRDLSTEMTEAEADERNAQSAYEQFMSDSASKRAKDVKAIEIKVAAKATDEQMKLNEEGNMKETKAELMATGSFQQQLHAECDWLLQNFDLRKQARSEEIDNLVKAKAVLKGADFSFAQLGSAKLSLLSRHRQ